MNLHVKALTALSLYINSVFCDTLSVDLCSHSDVTRLLGDHSAVQIRFDTTQFATTQWPVACNATIRSESSPEFLLSSYTIQFTDRDGLHEQSSSDGTYSWTPGRLKYWRCIGHICSNATILNALDFVYFHQKSELRFYFEYGFGRPADTTLQRADVTGHFRLLFTGEHNVSVSTADVSHPTRTRDTTTVSQAPAFRTGPHTGNSKQDIVGRLKIFWPVVFIPVILVALLIAVCCFLNHKFKSVWPNTPPPCEPPVYADMTRQAAYDNTANVTKEMLPDHQVFPQDMKNIPPPSYNEFDPGDVTNPPLDDSTVVETDLDDPGDVTKPPLDDSTVVEPDLDDPLQCADYTVTLQLSDSTVHRAPQVMRLSRDQPPAYDNHTYNM